MVRFDPVGANRRVLSDAAVNHIKFKLMTRSFLFHQHQIPFFIFKHIRWLKFWILSGASENSSDDISLKVIRYFFMVNIPLLYSIISLHSVIFKPLCESLFFHFAVTLGFPLEQ